MSPYGFYIHPHKLSMPYTCHALLSISCVILLSEYLVKEWFVNYAILCVRLALLVAFPVVVEMMFREILKCQHKHNI